MRKPVILRNCALDEHPDGRIILRGVIDPQSLELLQTGSYQREILPGTSQRDLMAAFCAGQIIPDIELGMRGGESAVKYVDDPVTGQKDGIVELHARVFIIDGLQRVSAAIKVLGGDSTKVPWLGAAVHINTNEDWERDRFRILNLERIRVSPNVLLRNLKKESPAVATLILLTTEADQPNPSVMSGRVSWQQRTQRGQLVSGLTMLKVATRLHGQLATGASSNQLEDVVRAAGEIVERIGLEVFRDNIKTFFEVIDKAWNIQNIKFKDKASYLKTNFLFAMAEIFAVHSNFWRDDNRLFVDSDWIRKLGQFDVYEPWVANMASSSGKAKDELKAKLVEHLNKWKRTKHLTPRRIRLTRQKAPDGAKMAAGETTR